MKIICPKDSDHKKFTVTAHVAESWLVAEDGEFIELSEGCTEVLHNPDIEDLYTCAECGAEAKVLLDDEVA